MNISKSDAERYVKEAYDALYKRASMSEEELLKMGYTILLGITEMVMSILLE